MEFPARDAHQSLNPLIAGNDCVHPCGPWPSFLVCRQDAPPAKPCAPCPLVGDPSASGQAGHPNSTTPVEADDSQQDSHLVSSSVGVAPQRFSSPAPPAAAAACQQQEHADLSVLVEDRVHNSRTMVSGLVRTASKKVAAGSVTALLKDTVGHGYWRELEPEQHEELRTAYQHSGANAAGLATCE